MSFANRAVQLFRAAKAQLRRAFDYEPVKHDGSARFTGLPDPELPRPSARRRRRSTNRGRTHDQVTGVRLTVKYPANGHRP